MNPRPWLLGASLLLLSGLLAYGEQAEVAELADDQEVSYIRDIAPVLKKNCLACHNQGNAEAGVNLESVETMTAADVDDVLVPGEADASRLFLVAAHIEEPVMPPEDNDVSAEPLDPAELALLRRWINSGARAEVEPMAAAAVPTEPLPQSIRTNYSAAITADGRLSVVSFGNQIQVFGANLDAPLATLQRLSADRPRPAHDDFVQDLWMDPNGQRVISAGYRNVKIWERQAPEVVALPTIDPQDPLALTLSPAGSHIAMLSKRGKLGVARIGKDEWQWSRDIEVPETWQQPTSTPVLLAVDHAAETVASAADAEIRIAGVDPQRVDSLACETSVTAMTWTGTGSLVAGDEAGTLSIWTRQNDQWSRQVFDVFDAPVIAVGAVEAGNTALIAVDEAGNIAVRHGEEAEFVLAGKLPANPASVCVHPDGIGVFAATSEGALGVFELAESKWMAVATSDPALEQKHQAAQWASLVGERLVAADEADSKLAETNVAAEQKSLEKLVKAVVTKNQARTAIETAAAQAEQAAAEAAEKASAEASQESDAQQTKLKAAVMEAKAAEATKARSEARLQGLQAELERWKAIVAAANAQQAERKQAAAASLKLAQESQAAGGGLACLAGGSLVLSRAAETGACHLWSGNGDWLGEIAGLDPHARWVAASGTSLLLQSPDGTFSAAIVPSSIWQHTHTIGAAFGDSPFEDRVLCVDVDPTGRFLATGGGYPSRAGELMIWNAADGSLLKKFDKPHADTVTSLAFSPDGKILATGGADRMVRLWDVETWELIKTLEGHTHHVTAIDWNVNRRQLATASADTTVRIWDVGTGKATRTIDAFKSEVTKLAYIGRDNRIAAITGSGSFQIYRSDNGRREASTALPGGYLYALDADRQGTKFVAGGATGNAVLLDKAGKPLQQLGGSAD
ncbi:WD40 domain-containing protein [Roseimaritima sediminicola]|uniref:WD40 domain-containing protein n=1 Tax=Roseimaritima sediminicola TaxID=2662066 RepID=UPI0012983BF7|nr:c-type cytochrome domain-containing protein [Roseimaritima sediminicola]